jgi:predicted nucleic acid-binding Zn finger protein
MYWLVVKHTRFHVVNELNGEFHCTCPNYMFRKTECKHIKMVKGGKYEREYRVFSEKFV